MSPRLSSTRHHLPARWNPPLPKAPVTCWPFPSPGPWNPRCPGAGDRAQRLICTGVRVLLPQLSFAAHKSLTKLKTPRVLPQPHQSTSPGSKGESDPWVPHPQVTNPADLEPTASTQLPLAKFRAKRLLLWLQHPEHNIPPSLWEETPAPLPCPPHPGRAAGTHVKAKKRVVAPTRKMAAAETGTYLLGLNLFPEAAGMLELWWGVRPAA